MQNISLIQLKKIIRNIHSDKSSEKFKDHVIYLNDLKTILWEEREKEELLQRNIAAKMRQQKESQLQRHTTRAPADGRTGEACTTRTCNKSAAAHVQRQSARVHAARVEPPSPVVVSPLRVGTRSRAFGVTRRHIRRSPSTAHAVSVEQPHKQPADAAARWDTQLRVWRGSSSHRRSPRTAHVECIEPLHKPRRYPRPPR